MSDFSLKVVRADDLLALRFELFNLGLEPDDGAAPRRLTRISPGDEARIVVHFPPQHISEEVFDENFGPPTFTDRIRSVIAGGSRVAFRVPEATLSLPLSIDSLLDWDSLEPVLVEAGDDDPLPPHAPAEDETAIEMPYRLMLAPLDGHWRHRAHASMTFGNVELWHTSYAADPTGPFGSQFRLKAIWSPDLVHPGDNPFPMSLNLIDRVEIVHLSSNRTLLADSNFQNLSEEAQRKLEALRIERSTLLLGEELRLGALGGWLNLHSRFYFPQLPAEIYTKAKFDIPDSDGIFFSLQDWSHHAVMGRDQYVKTVHRGFLYPFGHAASLIHISERKFNSAEGGERAAYLMQRSLVVVHEPERRYDHRAFPFTSIRIADTVIHADHATTPVFVPKVGGVPYRFPIVAADSEDRDVHFAASLVFVPIGRDGIIQGDTASIQTSIQNEYTNHADVDLSSQMVAFARDPASPIERERSMVPSRTTLRTVAMRFGVSPAVGSAVPVPILEHAQVGVPAVQQVLGAAAGTVTIKLNNAYLANGFTTAANNVFADIQGRMPLALPADKAGGIAAPNLEMTALSLTQGAFPDVQTLVAGGLTPEALVQQLFKGKLLGVIDLPGIVDFSTDKDNLPQIKPEAGGEQQVSFVWKPKLKDAFPKPLEPEDGTPSVEINGTISATTVQVNGAIRSVALSFLDVLRVGFRELTFRMESGRDPKFGASVSSFRFDGDLSFVDKLTQALPRDGFGGSGPSVKVTPEGATAGLTLAIPTIPLGPLFLQNLSLSAMLRLYFAGKPATMEFALSSRKDPFLVIYTVFGGGGHFAFIAGTDDTVVVDAALQFGGAAEIDIGIARGAVQVMVGIAFEMKDDGCRLTGFARVYGCVEILEIVTISVEFYLALSYAPPDAVGEASLTVMVKVLAFSKSVTLRVRKRFSTQDKFDRTSAIDLLRKESEILSVEEWADYCGAFAAA